MISSNSNNSSRRPKAAGARILLAEGAADRMPTKSTSMVTMDRCHRLTEEEEEVKGEIAVKARCY